MTEDLEIYHGIIRVWYRTGLNRTYSLTPDGFQHLGFDIDYISANGNTHRLHLNVVSKSVVSNASERESLASIKANAPQIFYYTGQNGNSR